MSEASSTDLEIGDATVPVSRAASGVLRAHAWDDHVGLLVYRRGGVEMHPLRSGVPLVLGRSPPAHIRISESCLSREHASFVLSGRKVTVEDLGSTNGTWVGGQRTTRAELRPGDEVVLGHLVVTIVELAPAGAALPGSLSYDRLRGALEDELVRARCFDRRFAVLVVRAAASEHSHVSRWYLKLRALLRPVDRTAIYGPDTIVILLPEAGLETASDLARRITELPSADEPALLVGLAPFPGVAATGAEKLLELCLATAHAATPEHPVQTVPLGTWTPEETPRLARSAVGPVSESAAMREIFAGVGRLARASIPVLIQGETGTGKEVVARALHEQGPRRARPMVCVNCGAIPAHLVESTLFGHERGAFTGAVQQQKGVFEAADGGTVFLDEIGELPAAAQSALLRVLETSRVVRVGGSREVEVCVRIVAATHRDLEAMCEAGSFRLDLLYRLNAMTLAIPPLRERPEDVAPLAERFLEQANQSNGRSVRGIDRAASELLRKYSWPGNVRELRNAIERAVVIAEGDTITVQDLSDRIRAAGKENVIAAEPPPEDEEPEDEPLDGAPAGARNDLKSRVLRYEAALIVSALRQTGWKQREAAEHLGLPLRTLVHKLKVLGIKKLGYAAPDELPAACTRTRHR